MKREHKARGPAKEKAAHAPTSQNVEESPAITRASEAVMASATHGGPTDEQRESTSETLHRARHSNDGESEEGPEADGATDYRPRVARAEAIVQHNVLWSLGAGVVPFPVADVLAITGVQMKMLRELSKLYGLAFEHSLAKKLVYSLLTGVGSVGLGSMLGWSLAKLVPGLGTTVGIVSVPILSGAFTHAIGRSFLMHFESGGTFFDFNPHAMRSYFREEYEKAKTTGAKAKSGNATVNYGRAT